MGQRCAVCGHDERARIELALAAGIAQITVARRFGVSKYSVHRHAGQHMPAKLKAQLAAVGVPSHLDLDELRKTESESLLQHIVAQRGRLYALLDVAEELADPRVAAQVHGRISQNLEMAARILGEINAAATHVHQNLIVSPEYLQLRQGLLQALRHHPEARAAVSDVLKRIDGSTPWVDAMPADKQPVLIEQANAGR